MAVEYVARFDTSTFELPDFLDRLRLVLESARVELSSEVSRLVPHEGSPTIDMTQAEPVEATSLAEIPAAVEGWWGFNLSGRSRHLAELGAGVWTEVDFAVFRGPDNRLSVQNLELPRANRLRVEREEYAHELYKLQLKACAALGLSISVYDAHGYEPPVATLHDVRQLVERAKRGVRGFSMAVSSARLTLHEGRARWPGRLRRSSTSRAADTCSSSFSRVSAPTLAGKLGPLSSVEL